MDDATRDFLRNRYGQKKDEFQHNYRARIFEAYGSGPCPACGEIEDMELAHVTDALTFVRRLNVPGGPGPVAALEASYRWDNLIPLGTRCHRVWTGKDERFGSPEVSLLYNEMVAARNHPLVLAWSDRDELHAPESEALRAAVRKSIEATDRHAAAYEVLQKETASVVNVVGDIFSELKAYRGWSSVYQLYPEKDGPPCFPPWPDRWRALLTRVQVPTP